MSTSFLLLVKLHYCRIFYPQDIEEAMGFILFDPIDCAIVWWCSVSFKPCLVLDSLAHDGSDSLKPLCLSALCFLPRWLCSALKMMKEEGTFWQGNTFTLRDWWWLISNEKEMSDNAQVKAMLAKAAGKIVKCLKIQFYEHNELSSASELS